MNTRDGATGIGPMTTDLAAGSYPKKISRRSVPTWLDGGLPGCDTAFRLRMECLAAVRTKAPNFDTTARVVQVSVGLRARRAGRVADAEDRGVDVPQVPDVLGVRGRGDGAGRALVACETLLQHLPRLVILVIRAVVALCRFRVFGMVTHSVCRYARLTWAARLAALLAPEEA